MTRMNEKLDRTVFAAARVALIIELLYGSFALAADPQLVRGGRIITDVGGIDVVSPDGQASSFLFSFLNVNSNPGRKMPLVVTRTATVNLPIVGNNHGVDLLYDIRGFVYTDTSTHASLIIQACGETTVVDLKKAIKDAKSPSTPKSKHKRTAPDNSKMMDDFYVRIKGTLPGAALQNVTFFLLVEKEQDDPNVNAGLWVDSMDVSIVESSGGVSGKGPDRKEK
jgi:hypothetical protein